MPFFCETLWLLIKYVIWPLGKSPSLSKASGNLACVRRLFDLEPFLRHLDDGRGHRKDKEADEDHNIARVPVATLEGKWREPDLVLLAVEGRAGVDTKGVGLN